PLSEFAGLRDGFKLVNGLCTQYTDTLISYPIEEGSDPTERWDPIVRLVTPGDPFISALRKIPLTVRMAPGPFSFWEAKNEQDYDVELKKLDESKRDAAIKRRPLKLPEIEGVFRSGARAFNEPLLSDIVEATAALAAIEETMREHMKVRASAANVR